MGDKNNWKAGIGLAAGIFAASAANASDGNSLDPQAMDDIKGLITYMATSMPVVPNQQSTDMQRISIAQMARPLNDVLEGCYGGATIADYAIALHVGLQNAVRTHSDALYISKAEAPFTELTDHIRDAAQWIPHVDEVFAAAHPEAQNFMDRLDQEGILEKSDTRMSLEAVISHNYPETETYHIIDVHTAPLQYYGPHSSMTIWPEFNHQVHNMLKSVNSGDPGQFWSNVPRIPPDMPNCG